MAININKLNANNNYNLNKPNIERSFSGLLMRQNLQATGNCGKLIPIFCRELLPNQKIQLNFNVGLQFTPFITNLLHDFEGEILTFFVPFRLLWDDWEKFITGGEDGNYTAEIPYIQSSITLGGVGDYIGLPIIKDLSGSDEIKINEFPIRAYNKIFNDNLRNLDIQKERNISEQELANAHWSYDYFNTARIFQIRGTLPMIPLSQKRPDTGSSVGIGPSYGSVSSSFDPTKVGINMNDFLTTFGITKYMMNNTKIKPRYLEQLKMRFGEAPTNLQLNIPDYLGMNKIQITTQQITQTAPTNNGSVEGVGNISGQTFGYSSNETRSYKAQEHGIIMSLMTIKPATVYELGVPKMWTRKTKYDYATPELENLPDTPIYTYELNFAKENRNKQKIFGWRNIYDEYRTCNNIVAKNLRPSIENGLKTYTLANKLEANVKLNSSFIECVPDMKRIKQYPNQDDFIFLSQTDIKTAIPIALQSNINEAIF